jgi:hypothetical protein
MIRLTGRGSPAEDTKKVRPAMPVTGVCPPGLSQSKPQTPRAERRNYSAVRGDCYSRVVKLKPPHEAMGLAESPAFRAPLGISGLPDMPAKEGPRVLEYGRARAG